MPTSVIIDKVEDDSVWVTGTSLHCNICYEWYSKVEDEKNKNGLDKGRVTKLVVRKGVVTEQSNEEEFWQDVVANYDRGWVIKPKTPAATEVFYAVHDELEKIESYKNRIYNGSLVKKVIAKTKDTFSFNI